MTVTTPTFQIRPANRSEAKPLIGIYSVSGKGKTYSALLLARGFVGPQGKIAMIETESGRGEAYSDVIPGSYLVIPMRDDFSPRQYGGAIKCAEEAGVEALIIDSASHEWEGTGGVLAMAAANQEAGKKGQAVWTLPKIEHQRHFMLRLLQTPIPLVIVCMRAKYPMEEKVVDGRKEWTRSKDLEPKQSEDILYEMFVHGWIDDEHRFNGTKYTRAELRNVLIDKQPLSLESGARLADWARGSVAAVQGVMPADIPACDICGTKLRFIAAKGDRPDFWGCETGAKHPENVIKVLHADLLKRIDNRKLPGQAV